MSRQYKVKALWHDANGTMTWFRCYLTAHTKRGARKQARLLVPADAAVSVRRQRQVVKP